MKIQFLIFKKEINSWVLEKKILKQKCCPKTAFHPKIKIESNNTLNISYVLIL